VSLNPFLMSKPHGPKRVLQKVSNSSRSLLRRKFFCGTVYVITLKLKPDRRSACAALYVACVMDSANLMPVGVVAPSQLISLFGSGLAEASREIRRELSHCSLRFRLTVEPGLPRGCFQ
jgi:hypothetical protein